MLETGINEISKEYEAIIEALALSLKSAETDESTQALKMIDALRQNFQIMLRLHSDVENKKQLDISAEEITKIGDYALNLLDEISVVCGSKGMQQQMLDLHRLSLPIVIWLKQHGGKIKKLDIVVNAIASYANTLQEQSQLKILCEKISAAVEVTEDVIKQDLEATNPMRPWRILNLNWGIVATRTHDTTIMASVFDQLMVNIPDDVQPFFKEGMQQMETIAYPQDVKELMKKYASGFVGDGDVLH